MQGLGAHSAEGDEEVVAEVITQRLRDTTLELRGLTLRSGEDADGEGMAPPGGVALPEEPGSKVFRNPRGLGGEDDAKVSGEIKHVLGLELQTARALSPWK